MARNSNKPWTDEDDDKLRALPGRHRLWATAAMRRSQPSVKGRAQELGLTYCTPTQERDRLRAAMSA